MKKDYLYITLFSLYFFIFGNWVLSITSLDEGRNLDATLRMLESGDFLIPRYNCDYRFEKPPLLYWLTSVSFLVFGVNEFSARLVSGLSALVLSFTTYKIVREFFNPEKALYSALILSTFLHLWIEARAAVPEMLLTANMGLALYFFLRERFSLGWIFTGLAFLTKGPVGVLLPTAVYLLWKRKFDFLKPKGILLFILIGFSWYGLMLLNFGYDYFYKFFIYENIMRFTGAKSLHPMPLYFYPLVLLASSIFYIPLLFKIPKLKGTFPLFLWLGFVLIFFSLSQNKLHHYILFAYPPLAILLSLAVGKNYLKYALLSASFILFVAYLYAPQIERERFVPQAVRFLNSEAKKVYFFRYENSAVVFYTRRCIESKENFSEGELIITKRENLKLLKGYRIILCGREFEGEVCLIKKL